MGNKGSKLEYPLHEDIKDRNARHYLVNRDIKVVCPKNIQTSDKDGEKPAHLAASSGDTEYIEFILEQCPEAFYLKNRSGFIPIQVARNRCHKKTYDFLLKWETQKLIKENGSDIMSATNKKNPIRSRIMRDWLSIARDIKPELFREGKFGDIFIVQLKSEQYVAVKVLERMRYTEAKILQAFDCPSILKFFGAHKENDKYPNEYIHFLFMEFISGSTLTDKILEASEDRQELPEVYQQGIAKQIFCALVYMKDKGLKHGDLKCDNVIINGANAKIVDFGSSSTNTSTSTILGRTDQYRAPEVLQNKKYTHKSDVFSAGIILFEIWVCRLRVWTDDCDETMMKAIQEKDSASGWKVELFTTITKEKPDERFDASEALGLSYLCYYEAIEVAPVDISQCSYCGANYGEEKFPIILCPDTYHLLCFDCIDGLQKTFLKDENLFMQCEMDPYPCANETHGVELCHFRCKICRTVSHMFVKKEYLLQPPTRDCLNRLQSVNDLLLFILEIIIPELTQINDKLQLHETNTTIARAAGAFFGIAGGIVSVVGAILIPFTFGVSTPMMIAGAAVAAGSSGVFLGSMGVDSVIKSLGRQDIAASISMFSHVTKIMQERRDRDDQFLQTLVNANWVVLAGSGIATGFRVGGLAGNITSAALTAAIATRAAIATTSLALSIVGSVISGITIFFDLYFFVTNLKTLIKREKSAYLQQMDTLIKTLEEEENELKQKLGRVNPDDTQPCA